MRYKIEYAVEEWHRAEVEADSLEEAQEKFDRNEWLSEPEVTGYGDLINDSVEIEEAGEDD
jgi:hypothetical protein